MKLRAGAGAGAGAGQKTTFINHQHWELNH